MHKPAEHLELSVIPGCLMNHETRTEVVDLCTRAFEEDYRDHLDTFHDATHIFGKLDGRLVTHALWVTRWLQIGDAAFLRTAYVEAVATDSDYRGLGFAQAVMKKLVDSVQGFDIAALSPFRVSYYERLGWEIWLGPLFVRTEDSLERSPDDDQVVIYRLPKTPQLDLSAPISVEWREGDHW